jgi:hypothetical protein
MNLYEHEQFDELARQTESSILWDSWPAYRSALQVLFPAQSNGAASISLRLPGSSGGHLGSFHGRYTSRGRPVRTSY